MAGDQDERAPRAEKQALDDQLRCFWQTHRNTMQRYFRDCGMFNGYPHMLFYLTREPGLTQCELSKRMGVSPPTLSVSVRRMEAAGLVRREPDENDARRTRLYLTEEGVEMDRRCRKGREFLIDTLYADFTEEDVRELSSLLTRMTENLRRTWDTLPQPEEN